MNKQKAAQLSSRIDKLYSKLGNNFINTLRLESEIETLAKELQDIYRDGFPVPVGGRVVISKDFPSYDYPEWWGDVIVTVLQFFDNGDVLTTARKGPNETRIIPRQYLIKETK